MKPSVQDLYRWPFVLIVSAILFRTATCEIAVISKDNATVAVFYDIEINLGAYIPEDGLAGQVVSANPPNGCSQMARAPNDTSVNWFALIRRYSCNFTTKVKNALEAGFAGVIVYNVNMNSESSLLPFVNRHISAVHGLADDLEIPLVLISHEDGVLLNRTYLYDKGYFVIITPDLQFNLGAYLLPFAIVISVCLVLMISFMAIKCIRDRRKTRRHRLSSRHLKKIPTTKYKKGDQYDTCAICLDEYTEGEKLRLLPCAHVYHLKCIDPWLTKNRRVCPVCKAKVVLPGVSDVSDSETEDRPVANERTPLVPNQVVPPQRRRRSLRRHRRSQRAIAGVDIAIAPSSSSQNQPEPSTLAPVAASVVAAVRSVFSSDRSQNQRIVTVDVNQSLPNPSGQFSVNCEEDLESPSGSREPVFEDAEPLLTSMEENETVVERATSSRRQRHESRSGNAVV